MAPRVCGGNLGRNPNSTGSRWWRTTYERARSRVGGFLVVAGIHEGEQGERRVAQPAEPVVPVADAADPSAVHEGDTAGWGNALPAFGAPAADDTTIHVVYACTAGTGSCATSNPAAQDVPVSVPWTNGNGEGL